MAHLTTSRSVLLTVTVVFIAAVSAVAVGIDSFAQTAPVQVPSPVSSNPAGSVVPPGPEPVRGPNGALDCQGCHGPGRTLPYLAGAQFHTDAHTAYGDGFHARSIQNGTKAATCLDCHTRNGDMSTMLPASDTQSPINRANVSTTCGRCHGDPNVMLGTGISTQPFVTYQESVHASAVSQGNLSAAVCTDCHNSHDVLPATDSRSTIFHATIPQTCGKCHAGITEEFDQSVHGVAAARGVSEVPVCTDCHGIHNILPEKAAATSLRMNSCERCHEGVRLTDEYGVAAGRVSSYGDSYHGLAKRLGSSVAADCASCHGVHNILPSTDTRSTISPGNLARTCGQCHPGASENFARAKVHVNTRLADDAGAISVRWIRYLYLGLIFVTIGGMVIHNGLALRRKFTIWMQSEHRTIERLSLSQRVQHWLLLLSFITLVVSGFALVYPEMFSLGMSEATRRLVHRVAAVVMMGVGIFHVIYVFGTNEGRAWVRDMMPERKDLRDVVQAFRYFATGRGERPKFHRFGYPEKSEYWAVVWGTVIMGATGLMIWFKVGIFNFLPRWWVDVAIAIHFYEAVLATLAILVWHLYHVIYDPDVYPVNLAFYDGRISEERYREEHELHYEVLEQERKEAAEAQASAEAPPEILPPDE